MKKGGVKEFTPLVTERRQANASDVCLGTETQLLLDKGDVAVHVQHPLSVG